MSDSGRITVNYFCLGAFFIFIGSVLLCALGFTVVLPFEVTRAWPPATCTVVNSSYEPNVCSCDEQLNVFDTCVSKYPCLQIHVSYAEPPGFQRPRTNKTGGAESLPAARGRPVGGHNRRRRSLEWIGMSSNITADGETLSIAEGSTEGVRVGRMWSSLVNAGTSNLEVSTVTVSETSTHTWNDLETAGELGDAAFVRRRSLLLSTSLPAVSGELENRKGLDKRNESLRMAKYEAENIGMDVARESMDRGRRVFATLYRSWDDSFNRKCTLTECGDETWNVKEARRFRDDWGRLGQSFICFYNPHRPDMVIIERTSTVAAVHAILWPGLCLVGGVTLWLGLCLGCWSLGAESTCKDDYGPIY